MCAYIRVCVCVYICMCMLLCVCAIYVMCGFVNVMFLCPNALLVLFYWLIEWMNDWWFECAFIVYECLCTCPCPLFSARVFVYMCKRVCNVHLCICVCLFVLVFQIFVYWWHCLRHLHSAPPPERAQPRLDRRPEGRASHQFHQIWYK